MWLAFDVHRSLPDVYLASPERIPASIKTYFLPCMSAAENGITRWKSVSTAIRQLPGLDQSPGISTCVQLIEDFLATKPPMCQELVRIIATDLKHPSKARIKLYFRCPENDFEGVWEWLTLGGRFTKYDDDKDKFKHLYNLVMGTPSSQDDSAGVSPVALSRIANGSLYATDGKNRLRSKRTTMCYFSLQGNERQPTPKLILGPKYSAQSDMAVAQGVAEWFQVHGWRQPGASLYQETIQQIL
jgi:DMATS type aromatic prenyltransferase